WQVSHGTATVPVWSHDGHELFYVKDGNMMAVEVHPGTPFTAGLPKVLFHAPGNMHLDLDLKSASFRLTPDDRRFLMIRNVTPWDTTGTPRLVLALNFLRQLEQTSGR
ncbi:MAG: hypothetical protein ACREN6_07570, partial [Gemmatimonadaceae bacterium]